MFQTCHIFVVNMVTLSRDTCAYAYTSSDMCSLYVQGWQAGFYITFCCWGSLGLPVLENVGPTSKYGGPNLFHKDVLSFILAEIFTLFY